MKAFSMQRPQTACGQPETTGDVVMHPASLTRWAARRAALALCLVALAGCGSLLPKSAPPPALYALDGVAQAMQASASTKPANVAPGVIASVPLPTLMVGAPRAAPGFDTAQIAYLRRQHQIEYFADSQWVDTPARMLAPLIAEAIGGTGAFSAVLATPSSAASDLRLDTEVIRLQQDFLASPSQVRLTLRAAVVHTGNRHVVAQREFEASVSATTPDAYGGVLAAQDAARKVLADLAAFCAEAAKR